MPHSFTPPPGFPDTPDQPRTPTCKDIEEKEGRDGDSDHPKDPEVRLAGRKAARHGEDAGHNGERDQDGGKGGQLPDVARLLIRQETLPDGGATGVDLQQLLHLLELPLEPVVQPAPALHVVRRHVRVPRVDVEAGDAVGEVVEVARVGQLQRANLFLLYELLAADRGASGLGQVFRIRPPDLSRPLPVAHVFGVEHGEYGGDAVFQRRARVGRGSVGRVGVRVFQEQM